MELVIFLAARWWLDQAYYGIDSRAAYNPFAFLLLYSLLNAMLATYDGKDDVSHDGTSRDCCNERI